MAGLSVTAFHRLVDLCESENQLNAVLIEYENRMSPGEEEAIFVDLIGFRMSSPTLLHLAYAVRLKVERFLLHVTSFIPGQRKRLVGFRLRKWAHSLWQHSRLAGLAEPIELTPVWRRGVTAYFRRAKPTSTLVIGFGGGHRLGMRTPTLLRFLYDLGSDVLLVTSRGRESYRNGLRGFAGGFLEGLDGIASFIADQGYTGVAVFGISKGAFPSLIAAPHLGARRALVMSLPRFEVTEPWGYLVRDSSERERLSTLWDEARTSVQTHVVFGKEVAKDRVASMALLSELANGQMKEVPDSPHVVNWPLAVRGELSPLFRRALGGL